MITISVLIPVYYSGDLLSKCIQSVLSQTVLPDEIIVFDDCPTSPMSKIISDFNSPILHYSINPINIGRTKNYRKLLTHASSEFVLILDGDDQLCDNNFFKEAKEVLSSGKFIAFTGGCINNYNHKIIERKLTSKSFSIDGFEYFKTWYSSIQTPPHSSTIFRKDIAIKLNCYTNDIINADILCQRILMLNGDFYISSHIFSQWNFTGNNSSTITSSEDFARNFDTIYIPFKRAFNKFGFSFGLLFWFLKATFKHYSSATRILSKEGSKEVIMFYYRMIMIYKELTIIVSFVFIFLIGLSFLF